MGKRSHPKKSTSKEKLRNQSVRTTCISNKEEGGNKLQNTRIIRFKKVATAL